MRLLLILIIVTACWSCSSEQVERPDAPNVILIISDDLSKNAISAYNEDAPKTPTMDYWSSKGWQFHNFYVTNPVCSPSRASILTGRLPHQNGVARVLRPQIAGQDLELADSLLTIGNYFQQAGYQTTLIGKWHLGYRSENYPLNRGFDHFYGFLSGHVDYISHVDNGGRFGLERDGQPWKPEEGKHLTELLTDEAIRTIRATPKQQPYFLVVSYANPHTPYLLPNEKAIFPGRSDRSRNTEDRYQQMVNLLDQQLARIHEEVDRDSNDNTAIVFLSDNGQPKILELDQEQKRTTGKGTMFEGGVNVPAFIYWPSQMSSKQVEGLYLGIDILPTLLQVAGFADSLEKESPGINMLDTLSSKEREVISLVHREVKMVRKGDWKAIFVPNNQSRMSTRHLAGQDTSTYTTLLDGHFPLLFNLRDDPEESQNIAADNMIIVNSLWQHYQNSK